MAVNLTRLHELALQLKDNGMVQTAGDIDYLISWLHSSDLNGDYHKKPDPAGPNTKDLYSNNCPIPYPVSEQTIIACKSSAFAKAYLYEAKSIIEEALSTYTHASETTALNEFISNIDATIELLS